MRTLKRLLLQNKAWALGQAGMDPEYFHNMALSQAPEILWIGCSDSRVPPDQVINTHPGNLFVHRNIANIVYAEDKNLLSVIEYAVRYLKVKYVVVCGHYGCGGVKAAMDGIDNPLLAEWTKKVAALYANASNKLDFDELVEMSVKAQVETLKSLPVITDTWKNSEYPKIVGWVYDLKCGLIKEITEFDPTTETKK